MFAEALPGNNLGFNVRGISAKELRCGFVVSNVENDPAQETASFIAQVSHCRFIFYILYLYFN